LENETEVTNVIAFFKELKIPADTSAYEAEVLADVPKALQRIQSGGVGLLSLNLSQSLSLLLFFSPQLCRCVREKEKKKSPSFL